MRVELLLGAGEFWTRLKADIESARHQAWVQTFTFEGDRAGTALARALERSEATDRRLLVDGYSLMYHNDRMIAGPAWLSRSFRREVLLTHRWVGRLRRGGVGVRFGSPLGPSPVRLIRRNHKKVAVIDDRVAYLGGINFSDHNFAWHDMMFRVESDELAHLLAADFLGCWSGKAESFDRSVGPLRVIGVNGRGNRAMFAPVIQAMTEARETIDVVSAYLSHPFTDHLAHAVRRGVRVRVLTPSENNKSNLARHVLECAARHGFRVLRYHGGMNHMKAMLIDREVLIAGSSNFDFMSYHILEELLVLTRHRHAVDAYRSLVWDLDLATSRPVTPRRSLGTRLGHASIRLGAGVAALLAHP